MRVKGVEKGDREEPAPGGGVRERSGRRLSNAKKRAARRGPKFFFPRKGVTFLGFQKIKTWLQRRQLEESEAGRARRLR